MDRSRVSSEHTRHAAMGKSSERFATELNAAKSHSLGRDRRVGQVMCYLSLIRSAALVENTAIVTCTKAIRQHFSSSRSEGKQAAHYLPGQLRVNGRCPWEFIRHRPTAMDLEGLFGDVENLPADFNKADSAAEAYLSVHGLRRAFAQSCTIVVQDSQPAEANRVKQVLVRRAYDHWILLSRRAYREALSQKEAAVNVPALELGAPGGVEYRMLDPANIEARHEAMHRDRHRIARAEFLKQYLATAKSQNLTDFLINEIEKRFRP